MYKTAFKQHIQLNGSHKGIYYSIIINHTCINVNMVTIYSADSQTYACPENQVKNWHQSEYGPNYRFVHLPLLTMTNKKALAYIEDLKNATLTH